MIMRSDVAQGSTGSLEAWKCTECEQPPKQPSQTVIDLTLDSDVEEIESESDDIHGSKHPPSDLAEETSGMTSNRSVEVTQEDNQQAHSNFRPYRPSVYLAHLTSNKDKSTVTSSKLPFPLRSRNSQSVLFGTTKAPSNSLSQWIMPPPIAPKVSPERTSRKKVASRLSGNSVTLQLKGLSDWVSYNLSPVP
ncbi:hypothetical protein FRC18_010567 [Serendipita sp. 400]|nr:hypothetical protein FRC18_010567 [Serendipita sp. 400]